VTTVDAASRALRLLGATERPGQRSLLDAHVASHGRLTVPDRQDDRWAEWCVNLIDESGLTGKGGAGFPTGAKLRWVRGQRRRPAIAVNVMEGEPASGKDQVLAVHVPHLILDGASVLAACLDARSVYVCVPREAEVEARSLDDAVAERTAAKLDRVPAQLVRPPGRYIAGEESALTSWLDGGDTVPRFRPDRPALNRVAGRTCLVENAETLAHVALIARHGAAAYRAEGTAEAPGTTLVTVSGAVSRTGVFEVALGTPLSSILRMAGAEPRPAGVLIGGYGGSWLGPSALDVPFDPSSLGTLGATPGAGVIVVLPPASCGVAETARIVTWMAAESAGQCGPCVFGLPALADDLMLLTTGRASGADLERLHARLGAVEGRGACRHPDGVVRLVRSALSAFADDVRGHLARCPCPGSRGPTVLPFPRQR
jgi:NADH:ubiquinone oxidoreductase subunit F (NADH-binding)